MAWAMHSTNPQSCTEGLAVPAQRELPLGVWSLHCQPVGRPLGLCPLPERPLGPGCEAGQLAAAVISTICCCVPTWQDVEAVLVGGQVVCGSSRDSRDSSNSSSGKGRQSSASGTAAQQVLYYSLHMCCSKSRHCGAAVAVDAAAYTVKQRTAGRDGAGCCSEPQGFKPTESHYCSHTLTLECCGLVEPGSSASRGREGSQVGYLPGGMT